MASSAATSTQAAGQQQTLEEEEPVPKKRRCESIQDQGQLFDANGECIYQDFKGWVLDPNEDSQVPVPPVEDKEEDVEPETN